ncbi:MAG: hypothetical protein HY744_19885 [Deltaproteobacteria bacterium]|nr:hypothetical protein [Deltaproteobacteria bacterium]
MLVHVQCSLRRRPRRARGGAAGAAPAIHAGLALLLLLLASGCTPQLEYLRVDADLTHGRLVQGRVAVMPVAVAGGVIPAEAARPMQRQIVTAVQQRRGTIPAVGLDAVARALAADRRFAELPVQYVTSASLPPLTVKELTAALGVRYLAFAAVTGYRHSTYDGARLESGGKAGPVEYTLRHHDGVLSASLTLFDGQSGAACWEGRHTVSRINTNEYDYAANIEAWADLAPEYEQYSPPPPAPAVLSATLFAAMVRNWPEPED